MSGKRFVFLCGGLEPAKDGVGDYCRRLSAELINLGYECMLISWNDSFMKEVFFEKSMMPVLRLPKEMNRRAKVKEVRNRIAEFQPNLISLQFVSYSFNERGIIYGLPSLFKEITKGYKTHIMFHELWLGAHQGASWKEKVIGTLQKLFIVRLIDSLQPEVIHTNTELFRFLLGQEKVGAKLLPVFSNIPCKASNDDEGWIYSVLGKYDPGFSIHSRSRHLVCMFFGSINPGWNFVPLIEQLKMLSLKLNKKVIICSSGKSGYGEAAWKKMNKQIGKDFQFYKFGELDDSKISGLLHFADLGLTSYPDALIGKSGSVAAMLEHGLPVVVSNYTLKISGFNSEGLTNPLLIDLEKLEASAEVLSVLKRDTYNTNEVKIVARQWLNDLNV